MVSNSKYIPIDPSSEMFEDEALSNIVYKVYDLLESLDAGG